jgi:hypothetical protein
MRKSAASDLASRGNVVLALGLAARAPWAALLGKVTLDLPRGARRLRDWLVSQRPSPKLKIIARLVLHNDA